MDGRGRRYNKETYDLGVGFFGFFAVAFFAASLFLQLSGRDALWASASAVVAFVILGIVWVARRRYLARTATSSEDPQL